MFFYEGKFEKAGKDLGKALLIQAGQEVINRKIDKIPGASKLTKSILRQNVDVKIKGTERLYNYLQDQKTETNKNNNKVKIEKH